ncbi:MAG: CDP-alcohol phosphatidyltransferase family protein [Candidatus Promineifilaceae bacterium]|nr:CDP-alcohol phosphatidyltransferase family protein [Candidatus Promineifilaceae bacterium]
MSDPKEHERVNDILLGPVERPLLRWLAAHLPHRITPDALTLIGVGGALTILVGYTLTRFSPWYLWLATIGFVINWFGDSLDGTVARYRDIERPKYGFFVDHTVDAFGQLLMFVGLGLSPYFTFGVAMLALVGYLLMSIYVYVDTYVTGRFKISYGKLGPTEMRLIAILLNTFIFFFGVRTLETAWGAVALLDIPAAIIAAALIGLFCYSTVTRALELRPEGK